MSNTQQLEATAEALRRNGMEVIIVDTRQEALERMSESIPKGASVMNGSSTSLAEIGMIDRLKSADNGWNNLHDELLKETDWAKQGELRRKAIADADVFLGSVNAVTEDGKLIAVDATGSRVGAYVYVAKKVLLVVGKQKIVANLDDAMKRITDVVFPLEDERAKKAYGMGSGFGKWIMIERESVPGRIVVILVKENLGF